MSVRRIVVSGCSGGGKTTLVSELARLGFATMAEPGRDIVREQLAIGGTALPWTDMTAFASLCLARARAQFDEADSYASPVIFDRCMIDAVTALAQIGSVPKDLLSDVRRRRYDFVVFMAPPWQRHFSADLERRHTFASAVAEYKALLEAYAAWGYQTIELPLSGIEARAAFVRHGLGDT